MGYFFCGLCGSPGQMEENRIIQFIFLKIPTVDSEHLSTAVCHSNKHISALLAVKIFLKEIICLWSCAEEGMSMEAFGVVYNTNDKEVFGIP